MKKVCAKWEINKTKYTKCAQCENPTDQCTSSAQRKKLSDIHKLCPESEIKQMRCTCIGGTYSEKWAKGNRSIL